MGLIANIRHVVNSDNPKVRLAIAAVAIVVTLGAIGLMIYALGDWDRTTEQQLPPLKYFCLKCRKEFDVTHQQRSRLDAEAAGEGRAGLRAIDCPLCEAKASAYAMFHCPNPECRKYFVTPADKAHYRSARGGAPPDDADTLLCPHCGVDADDWRRGRRPK